jgi:hypothetical protein
MIEAFPLHDATLKTIEFSWADAVCVLRLATSEYPEYELVFGGIREVFIPHKQAWGPSVSINSVTECGEGCYEIEMQSGDVLRIVASHFSFNPVSSTPGRVAQT